MSNSVTKSVSTAPLLVAKCHDLAQGIGCRNLLTNLLETGGGDFPIPLNMTIYFGNDSTDSPNCLSILLSVSVFLF